VVRELKERIVLRHLAGPDDVEDVTEKAGRAELALDLGVPLESLTTTGRTDWQLCRPVSAAVSHEAGKFVDVTGTLGKFAANRLCFATFGGLHHTEIAIGI